MRSFIPGYSRMAVVGQPGMVSPIIPYTSAQQETARQRVYEQSSGVYDRSSASPRPQPMYAPYGSNALPSKYRPFGGAEMGAEPEDVAIHNPELGQMAEEVIPAWAQRIGWTLIIVTGALALWDRFAGKKQR